MSEPSDDAPTDEPAETEPSGPAVGAAAGPGRPTPSPLVRRLAAEFGVDLDTIDGTGPGGRVVREDVQRAAFGGEPLPGSTDAGPEPDSAAGAEPPTAADSNPLAKIAAPAEPADDATATGTPPSPPPDDTPLDDRSDNETADDATTDTAPNGPVTITRPDAPTDERSTVDAAPTPDDEARDAGSTHDESTADATPTRSGERSPLDDGLGTGPVATQRNTDTGSAPVAGRRVEEPPVAGGGVDSNDGGQHPPVLGMTIEVDGAQLVVAHERLRAESGRQISLDALLVKLVAATLPEFPELATDPSSPAIAFVRPGQLGLDRATVVGAAQMSLTELDVRMDELVRRSTAVEASRPALTVIDGGRFGVTAIAPTLGGATAAVAFGTARPTVTIVDGSPKAGATLSVTGVFDDSVVDLARAAAFLNRLRIYLEDPILAFVG